MKTLSIFALFWFAAASFPADLQIYPGGAFHVLGDQEDEWRFESTTNFSSWRDASELGTMFSDAGPRSLTNSDPHYFFRAVRTSGLFDDRVIRRFDLTFPQATWQSSLDRARMTGSNVLGTLSLDNGLTNTGIGARYKGNSSYGLGGLKKSINIELDFADPDARLMGHKTINLNNAAADETIMREPIYFTVMNEYAPSPKAALARLFINGTNWGVYSLAEQENSVLIKDWFPSTDGDRWRTPNIGGQSAMVWLGGSVASYRSYYDLRASDDSTNAWKRLTNAIYVLNNTPTNIFRRKVEEVYAVDRWLWFLAVENVFADEDSYMLKGSDYSFYYEPESGRIHPIEHDGNEAFQPGDQNLTPVQGGTAADRPLLSRLLRVPELRQRYLAHMRTVLSERYNPEYLTPLIDRLQRLSSAHIAADPKKNFTMTAYTNELRALKQFVTNRFRYLSTHAELRPLPPVIERVNGPEYLPLPGDAPILTAKVAAAGTNSIDSVWLYWRTRNFGVFLDTQMFDDGLHGDGPADDGVFGAGITNYPAGTLVLYYVEARSANPAKAASYSPARAEQETYNYRVRTSAVSDSPVVINEFLAENQTTLADPQGEFDDWIELYNSSAQEFDLTGCFLSDSIDDPRKWQFPDGTKIAAGAYLIVWADEDGLATEGLHANFKLSNNGEQVLLVDADERLNRILDQVTFGKQGIDYSHGRNLENATLFKDMLPSPGSANK